MTKLLKKPIMKGYGSGFSRIKQNSPEECITIKDNPITTDNISPKPKLKSALKSKYYTRKKVPVTFSTNTKMISVSATPNQKKKIRYTSMKKRKRIDSANARIDFKTKAQQSLEDIQPLREQQLINVSV